MFGTTAARLPASATSPAALERTFLLLFWSHLGMPLTPVATLGSVPLNGGLSPQPARTRVAIQHRGGVS